MRKFHFKNCAQQEMAEGDQKLLAQIQRSWQEAGVSGTRQEVQTVLGVLADTGIYILCF